MIFFESLTKENLIEFKNNFFKASWTQIVVKMGIVFQLFFSLIQLSFSISQYSDWTNSGGILRICSSFFAILTCFFLIQIFYRNSEWQKTLVIGLMGIALMFQIFAIFADYSEFSIFSTYLAFYGQEPNFRFVLTEFFDVVNFILYILGLTISIFIWKDFNFIKNEYL
eukprot:TRINITY_DN667_c0_g1_i1.p1 TRINITY_DN667_c0_g1~~TRINITY_DN667_c0_g1_i1.p1  ORF type:complete len:168 (-),score=34.21 TRINITY_DN667_c0_g1_i1:78-581(-)